MSQDPQTGQFLFAAIEGISGSFNWLRILMAPTLPLGSYDLAEQDLSTCGACLTIDRECLTGGGQVNCASQFTPESGTLFIDSAPAPAMPIEANGTGLPVANKPTEATCIPEGNGQLIASNIGNYALRNCLGEYVELHDACENGSKATWIFGTAGWCTACTEVLSQVQAVLGVSQITRESLDNWPGGLGLDLQVILFEDAYTNMPTEQYCLQYANSHNLDPAILLMDTGAELRGRIEDAVLRDDLTDETWCLEELEFSGSSKVQIPLANPLGYAMEAEGLGTTWSHINPYLQANSQGMIESFTPWYAVLDSRNMEYLWSSYYSQNVDPILLIDGLLAAP